MKTLICTTLILLASQWALALDTSAFGSMTEYSCIVTIEGTASHGGDYTVSQTCNDSQSTIIGNISSVDINLQQLQVKIIKAMRPKGFDLVTQSTLPEGVNSVSMIFQKLN